MGRGAFTWRRLRACIEALRHTRESAFWRAVDTDGEGLWGVSDYHLANVVDMLAVANWQRSGDGSKNRNRPKPVARPGQERAKRARDDLIQASIAERKRRRAQRSEQQRG